MATYGSVGDPTPLPDVLTARERVVGADIGINDVVRPLIETLVNRTEDAEDRLVPVYSLLTDEAKRRVEFAHENIGNVALPLINNLRGRIGQIAGTLAGLTTVLPPAERMAFAPIVAPPPPGEGCDWWVMGAQYTDGRICPISLTEGEPKDKPVIFGAAILTYGPLCLEDAQKLVLELREKCGLGIPGPVPVPEPVPVPVPVPEPVPVPGPIPEPRPVPEPVPVPVPVPVPGPVPGPVPVPIPAPKPGECIPICPVEPPKCPAPEPKPPGPVPVPGPVPPGPVPPGPVPVPGPPEPPPEPLPGPEPRPRLPDTPRHPGCKQLEFAHKDICKCIPQYIEWFDRLGSEALKELTWLDNASANLNEGTKIIREAAIGIGLLRWVTRKIRYTDPTVIDAAEMLAKVAQQTQQTEIVKIVREWWRILNEMVPDYFAGNAKAFKGLYIFKSIVQFVERHSAGYLTGELFGTTVIAEWQHLKKIIGYCESFIYPIELPSLADVENLWLTGGIADAHAECLVAMHGQQWDIIKPAWLTRRTQPTTDDYIQYYYRNLNKQKELDKRLAELGMKNPEEREILRASRVYLPPPSDIIHWTIRDVFDPGKLGRAEMLEEFKINKGLQELFDAQGMSDVTITTKDGRKIDIKTAENTWLASYDEISPTQSYEMLHRLRKDRLHRLRLPGQNDGDVQKMEMTIEHVRKLLKEKDYNPIWRDRLAAISYRVLGRIDIRRMYEFGVFGTPKGSKGFALANPDNPIPIGAAEKEVVERYRDLGSTEIDARLQALFTVRLWERSLRSRNAPRIRALACSLYTSGVIDRDKAKAQLVPTFELPEEADQYLDVCEATEKLRTVKFAVGTVKRQYLSFQIDENTAKMRLGQIGVQPLKTQELITHWNLVKLRKPKQESAAEMCGWLAEGLIDRKEFLEILKRIGYEQTHAERIVRKCETGILRRSAKEVERIARARMQERRRQEAAQAKIDRERSKLEQSRLTKFLATRSEKHLIDWFKEGLISVPEIQATLLAKSYTQEDVNRWILTYLKPKE